MINVTVPLQLTDIHTGEIKYYTQTSAKTAEEQSFFYVRLAQSQQRWP